MMWCCVGFIISARFCCCLQKISLSERNEGNVHTNISWCRVTMGERPKISWAFLVCAPRFWFCINEFMCSLCVWLCACNFLLTPCAFILLSVCCASFDFSHSLLLCLSSLPTISQMHYKPISAMSWQSSCHSNISVYKPLWSVVNVIISSSPPALPLYFVSIYRLTYSARVSLSFNYLLLLSHLPFVYFSPFRITWVTYFWF